MVLFGLKGPHEGPKWANIDERKMFLKARLPYSGSQGMDGAQLKQTKTTATGEKVVSYSLFRTHSHDPINVASEMNK